MAAKERVVDVLIHPENPNIKVYFGPVGPAKAKSLLETYHVDYRKYRPTYAEGLSRDMVNKYWNFDGSPIRIDDKKNLFDGQHRLNAVSISDTTQVFLIIEGLPEKAYDTTDTGLPRNHGDTLRRRGYNNVSVRAALVKLIARWEEGRSLSDTKRLTHSELDAYHDKYVDTITRSVALTVGTARKVFVPTGVMAFVWWKLRQTCTDSGGDPSQADEFLMAVAEGEHLQRGMPEYALRERLLHSAEEGLTRNELAHYFFQAWNAKREGRELIRVSLPRGIVGRNNMAEPH
jgi:hypothetical protein